MQDAKNLPLQRYPKELARKVRIAERDFIFRPIKPGDEGKMKKLFESFSPATVLQRFGNPIKEMTHSALLNYCVIDYSRDIAIIAELQDSEEKELVAVGRFMRDSGPGSAEFAIVVTDAFQSKGIGKLLLRYLQQIAENNGIKKLWGLISAENKKMLRMAEKEGYSLMRDSKENAIRVEKIL